MLNASFLLAPGSLVDVHVPRGDAEVEGQSCHAERSVGVATRYTNSLSVWSAGLHLLSEKSVCVL